MIPTVGFNMRKITKGNVTIKVDFYYLHFLEYKFMVLIFSCGISAVNHDSDQCGSATVVVLMPLSSWLTQLMKISLRFFIDCSFCKCI